jgi:hypothetical protein
MLHIFHTYVVIVCSKWFICHYWNLLLCRVPRTRGKATKILGKDFAECNTRQRALGKNPIGKGFAESPTPGKD